MVANNLGVTFAVSKNAVCEESAWQDPPTIANVKEEDRMRSRVVENESFHIQRIANANCALDSC